MGLYLVQYSAELWISVAKRCGRKISEQDGRMECREYLLEESLITGGVTVCWRSRCLLEKSIFTGGIAAYWRNRCLLEELVVTGGVAA